jgi:nucleoside-diphosphate-sugar epimerase
VPRPVDPYGVSKLEAEQVARDVAARRGLQTTVLRFPLVYGPGVRGNMLSLFQLVNRGVPLPLGRVRNRRSMLFVGNLAAAITAVLGAPATGFRVFFVADGTDVSTPELVRLIGAALGRKARLLPVPVVMFRAAGRVGDVLSRMAPLPLTSAAVDRLLGSLPVDASALGRTTGFRPPFSVEQGLRRTADWFLDPGGRRA